MSDSDMQISGRAWGTEAAMGHCVIWGETRQPPLPAGRFNGKIYARELVQQLRWGAEHGINGANIMHGDRGGYADPGGLLLENEAQRLGIPYSIGGHVGHGFPYWMPEELFRERPELFRMGADGKRTPTGNFCTSNAEALGRAVGELTKLLDRHPRMRLMLAIPDDVLAGSWCSCPLCEGKTPAEQYATLVSAAAGAMDARLPGTQMGFVLYHDTLEGLPAGMVLADGRRFLPPNVYALYGGRERCYAHAIDDASCPRNRYYWRGLQQACKLFEGRVDIFDYYGDTILWQYFNVAIPHVIAADLRAYHHLSVREVQCLVFGTYSHWAHGLNLAVYAWLASGKETDVDTAIAHYAQERFGTRSTDRMVAYYNALEAAQAGYLGFCGYEDAWMHDLRWFSRPSPWYGEHRRRVVEAKDGYRRLAELLAPVVAGATEDPYLTNLKAEQTHLEITRIELEELDNRLAVGERATAGDPARPTDQETAQRIQARQQQWDLAQAVPAGIRGEAFGALAP